MGRRKKSTKNGSTRAATGIQKPAGPTSQVPPLAEEDAVLWDRVTQSLSPLKGQKDRLHFGPLLDDKPVLPTREPTVGLGLPRQSPEMPELDDLEALRAAFEKGISKSAIPQNNENQPQGAVRAQDFPLLADFTRREMRQINSGRQPIEARLDLHGLYQDAAHMALRNFLQQCHHRDLRHVLVITGKGRTSISTHSFFDEPEQGVLRRVVPIWLGEPELSDLVNGFSQAPRRHGGEGALYVRLRRNRA